MQKVKLLMILLLTSCTYAKKVPPETIGIIIFEEVIGDKKYFQNFKINIEHKVCATDINLQKNHKARTDLIEKFQEKFAVKLVGYSNITINSTRIIDSSIFIPNETCSESTFNPVKAASTTSYELKAGSLFGLGSAMSKISLYLCTLSDSLSISEETS